MRLAEMPCFASEPGLVAGTDVADGDVGTHVGGSGPVDRLLAAD